MPESRPQFWPDVRTAAVVGIFLLLAFGALYQARGFFLPVAIAVMLSLLLAPVVAGLHRLGLPESLGSLLVLFAFFVIVVVGAVRLAEPANQWMDDAPRHLRAIEEKLRNIKEPVHRVADATERVENLATVDNQDTAMPVQVERPRLAWILLSGTREFVALSVVVMILLYFLLASGDLFLRKLVAALPRLSDKRRAVEMARQVRHDVSRYLLTITLVNAALASAATLAFALLGMPNPLLWGALAGLLNYVPFFGPVVTFSVVTMVSLLSFDSTGHALLVPAVYGAINFVEGNLITPLVIGRSLVLNPVAVFLSLMLWGWLWGIAGALLAVPLLAVLKLVCDNVEPLQPLGTFLGR